MRLPGDPEPLARTDMTVIVTGAAGFIGFHVSMALLDRGERVIGVDNVNAYYDPSLKEARVSRLQEREGFSLQRLDIADRDAVFALFEAEPSCDRVVHLAAQAGVRHSLTDPYTYIDANVMGHLVMMEACRRPSSLVFSPLP